MKLRWTTVEIPQIFVCLLALCCVGGCSKPGPGASAQQQASAVESEETSPDEAVPPPQDIAAKPLPDPVRDSSPEEEQKSPDGFLSKIKGFKKVFDWCLPLEEPAWKPGSDASFMRPDDPVVGFMTEKGAYALPWWILKNHHVANLDVDGEEILVTLCEACTSAAAFDPRVDGVRLHFRIVGMYNGTHILGDRETDTYWLSFLGTAQYGPQEGKQLKRRRVDQSTWSEWLEMHPETFVAYRDVNAREGHGSEDFPGRTYIGKFMFESRQREDDRLPMHSLILGVTVQGEDRAYPMKTLTESGPIVEDRLGDQPIVVFHKPGSYLAAAFFPEIDGQLLNFSCNEQQEIVDTQTKSVWNYAGVAQTGPLAGKQLKPTIYIMEEWYIWVAYHQQFTLYTR